jgi:hypothetical protein
MKEKNPEAFIWMKKGVKTQTKAGIEIQTKAEQTYK